jgi:hypothetical protein
VRGGFAPKIAPRERGVGFKVGVHWDDGNVRLSGDLARFSSFADDTAEQRDGDERRNDP